MDKQAREATTCRCEEWIKSLPIPGKVIGFRCSSCNTEYTLFPNGEIVFSQVTGAIISGT